MPRPANLRGIWHVRTHDSGGDGLLRRKRHARLIDVPDGVDNTPEESDAPKDPFEGLTLDDEFVRGAFVQEQSADERTARKSRPERLATVTVLQRQSRLQEIRSWIIAHRVAVIAISIAVAMVLLAWLTAPS